jgi:membrane fusion protein (multidrug efflux system)
VTLGEETKVRSGVQERPQTRILIALDDADALNWLFGVLFEHFDLSVRESAAEAVTELAAHPPEALIVGPALTDMSGPDFIDLVRQRGGAPPVLGLVAPGSEGWCDDLDLFYAIHRSLGPADVREVVASAARARRDVAGDLKTTADAQEIQHALALARRIALQRDVDATARLVVEATAELAVAERAQCLFYDAASGTLWSSEDDDREHRAAAGIAGFAARTGAAVTVARVGDDPRFAAAIDDPEARGDEHLIAQPARAPDGSVHAVLIAVRSAAAPPFHGRAQKLLALLAEHVGPVLHQLELEAEAESVLEGEESGDELFRSEALSSRAAERDFGDLLRLSPAWIGYAYWLVVAAFVAAGAYAAIGRIDEYSAGPAVIEISGRTELTAPRSVVVGAIPVKSGQTVTRGEALVRFQDTDQEVELARVEHQWEAGLRDYLAHPQDPGARKALASLRAERDKARAQMAQRVLRAPKDGVVTDLRIREGQHLDPGQTVLSLASGDGRVTVTALLPGKDRPLLEPGNQMLVELVGYRDVHQTIPIESVDDEVVGPQEASRFLGQQLQGSIPIDGPVVLVRGRLPRRSFVLEDTSYDYHDGMAARAEVAVRRRSILRALVPAL